MKFSSAPLRKTPELSIRLKIVRRRRIWITLVEALDFIYHVVFTESFVGQSDRTEVTTSGSKSSRRNSLRRDPRCISVVKRHSLLLF